MQPSLKQEKFTQKYLSNGGNGTAAAIEAYDIESDDPKNVAASIASKQLRSAKVQSLISAYTAGTLEKVEEAFLKAISSASTDLEDKDPEVRSRAVKSLIEAAKLFAPTRTVEKVSKQQTFRNLVPQR